MADNTNSTPTVNEASRPDTWGQAYAEYRHLRAVSDAIPLDDEGGDEAVEAYVQAMDHLLENVRAPDADSLQVKRQLAKERYDGGGWHYPEQLIDALIEDARFIGATRTIGNSGSIIAALHRRFEAAWAEHHVMDCHEIATKDDHREQNWCRRGQEENEAETDALRIAILYQVPNDQEDLALLSYHVWSVYDEGQNSKREMAALTVALTSLFDYVMDEAAGRVDMSAHGKMLNTATMLAYHRRRYRTGLAREVA